MTGKAAPKWLAELLTQNSFLRYHSYHRVVRHNHKAHGAVAIQRLGGSQERVEKYFDVMKNVVEQYKRDEPPVEPLEIDFLKADNLKEYRGKNQAFYKMYDWYSNLYETKYDKNIISMIKDVCPEIIDGPMYGAFHGIIHMAYGLAGGSDQVVLEGITYMDQQYSPLYIDELDNPKRTDLTPFGKGNTDIMDLLKKLNDENFVKQISEENKKDLQLRKDTHMYGIFGWPGPKYHSDFFMDLVNDLKLPEWFKPMEKDMKQLERLIDWFFDLSTVLFIKCHTVNDFFMLHGVTGTWSAKQILPLLDFDSALNGLRSLISGVCITYVFQGAPVLDRRPEDFYEDEVTKEAWQKIIEETLNGGPYEIHVYKVLQCMYDRWQDNPDSEYAKYYIAAGDLVRKHHFGRGPTATFPNNDIYQ